LDQADLTRLALVPDNAALMPTDGDRQTPTHGDRQAPTDADTHARVLPPEGGLSPEDGLPPEGSLPPEDGLPPEGTWEVDQERSSVQFVARQFLVHRVRGRFTSFQATAVVTDDPWVASVRGEVATHSVDTGDPARDAHLRSADFFDVARWPTMRLEGQLTRSSHGAHRVRLDGGLTIRDITQPVVFDVRLHSPGVHLETVARSDERPADLGSTIVSATATATVSRSAFGLRWNATIETGGVVVADQVELVLELVARRNTP